MNARGTATWVGGAVVVALLIVAAAWFLLLSPLQEDTERVRAQAATAEQQNDLLAIQVAGLKADHAKLPEYKAELAALRVQVPATIETSALLRELDGHASASGVRLEVVSFMPPTELQLAEEPAPAPVPTEGAEDGAAADAAGAQPAVATSGPRAPRGLVGQDLTLTVAGAPEAVGAFFTGLQDGSTRLILVTGFDLSRQEAQGGSPGQAAVVDGDLSVTIQGTVYVLPAPGGGAAAPAGELATGETAPGETDTVNS